MNVKDLKPCPFCGGLPYEVLKENTANGLDGIICGMCDIRIFKKDIELARDIWNIRALSGMARFHLVPLLDSVNGDCFMGKDFEEDKVYELRKWLYYMGEVNYMPKDEDK